MKKISLHLETLACPTCAQKIQTALQKSKGVQEATVLFNASKAKVAFDENLTNPAILKTVVESLGYEVEKVK